MHVNNNHQNYKRTIHDADTRAALRATLSEAYATYDVKLLQAHVQFDIRTDRNKTDNETMYTPEASKDWFNNISENHQRNSTKYEHNEDVDTNNLSRNLANLITHSRDRPPRHDSEGNRDETNASDIKELSSNNMYAEKTTYCRPVCNVYNQEFIYKMMERNAKLQLLLKKLVLARRKEKEEKEGEEWNNYVNKLRNRCDYHCNEPRYIAPQERSYLEPKNDIHEFNYNAHSPAMYIQPARNLHDHEHSEAPRYNYNAEHKTARVSPEFEYGHENRPSCYITSSLDRLLTLPNEWQLRAPHTIKPDHPRYTPPRIPDDSREYEDNRKSYCKRCLLASRKDFYSRETNAATSTDVKINSASQTQTIVTPNTELMTDQKVDVTTKDQHEEMTENVNTPKNLCDFEEQEIQRQNSLKGIETKLESLASSIKAVLSKLESDKKVADTTTACACGDRALIHVCKNMTNGTTTVCDRNTSVPELLDRPEHPERPECPGSSARPDFPGRAASLECPGSFARPECPGRAASPECPGSLARPECPGRAASLECPGRPVSLECPDQSEHLINTYRLQTKYVVRPPPTRYRNYSSSTSKIDKILCEELDKSNRLRKDIEEIIYQSNPACAVQISFDIPTRECSTEVTDSLSKTKLMEDQDVSIEELRSLNARDRQMTIAVNTDPMGLLAWFRMSSETLRQLISYVPCVDYSRYLSRLPLPQLTAAAVDYVCNICGACFSRPSLLNDHIRTHDLGNSRNCCVCHHVLDIKRRSTRSPALFACRYCGQRFTRAYCCELHEQSCARALGRDHDVRSGLGLLR